MTTWDEVLAGHVPEDTRFLCPFHDDRNHPSAGFYKGGAFYCFTCGASATDAVQFVRQLLFPHEHYGDGKLFAETYIDRFLPAARRSTGRQHIPPVNPPASPNAIQAMTEFSRLANDRLSTDSYLPELSESRGLQNPIALGLGLTDRSLLYPTRRALAANGMSVADISAAVVEAGICDEDGRYRLGQRLLIPEVRNNGVIYYQARVLPGRMSDRKYLNPKGIAKPLFGLETLERDHAYLVLAEGTFDVLPLIEHGWSAIAVLGADIRWTELDVDQLKNRTIIVGLDNDPTGHVKGEALTAALIDMGLRATRVAAPDPHKDYGEWIAAAGIAEVTADLQFSC